MSCARLHREQLQATRATLSDGSSSEVALGRPGEPLTFESLSKSRGAPVSAPIGAPSTDFMAMELRAKP